MNVARSLDPHPPRRADASTALVVGGDATSRRFVELALDRSGGFVVESARDAASAFELLGGTRVDLIIADTDLADASGLAFYRRLGQESRLRNVPFVFLSADASVDAKVAALRAGVDDYLVKPCDASEIVARAEAIVARHRRAREARRARTHSLVGDFSAMAFPEIIGIVEMGRRSGVLAVVTPEGLGSVHFDEGAIVHVVFVNLVGEDAFQQIFAASSGHFELTPGPCLLTDAERTIGASVTALVMEAARVFDDTARMSGELRALPFIPATLDDLKTLPPRSSSARRAPALEADRRSAAQFELAVRDPFVLGELRAWTRADLAKWTHRDVARDRLHVVLVADMSVGVSSILGLGLGGAPTERWVLDTLSPEAKSFGLTFFLRHERALDIVLVDIRDPGAILPALRCTPSIVLLAPPDGDLLSLGAASRVSLAAFLDELAPPAVIASGNASLASSLSRMALFDAERASFSCNEGVFGEGIELRDLLAEGIRLWAHAARARPSIRAGER